MLMRRKRFPRFLRQARKLNPEALTDSHFRASDRSIEHCLEKAVADTSFWDKEVTKNFNKIQMGLLKLEDLNRPGYGTVRYDDTPEPLPALKPKRPLPLPVGTEDEELDYMEPIVKRPRGRRGKKPKALTDGNPGKGGQSGGPQSSGASGSGGGKGQVWFAQGPMNTGIRQTFPQFNQQQNQWQPHQMQQQQQQQIHNQTQQQQQMQQQQAQHKGVQKGQHQMQQPKGKGKAGKDMTGKGMQPIRAQGQGGRNICFEWARRGTCKRGNTCPFVHGS